MPLRLCTSERRDAHLPLICLRYHEVKVRVEMDPAFVQADVAVSLLATYVALDTDERREICQGGTKIPVSLKATTSVRLSVPIASGTAAGPDGSAPACKKPRLDADPGAPFCRVDVLRLMRGAVRDLLVTVRPLGGPEQRQAEDPLIGMKLVVNVNYRGGTVVKAELDGPTLRTVVLEHTYGVAATETNRAAAGPLVYCMPFDNTPSAGADGCSGCFNGRSIESAELQMRLAPGEYEVHVLARTFNVLLTEHGMGGLKYKTD